MLMDWKGAPPPALGDVSGRYARLRPFDYERDRKGLFASICGHENDDLWTYIPQDRPENADALGAMLLKVADDQGWQTYVILTPSSEVPLGMASYMRIRPGHGSAEAGCIIYSRTLQRTRIATEALYLMIKHAFDDLGYRRFEWKCDNRNEASRRAAKRLGFTFEGIFRNDLVVKGHNRDTAWFSIIDTEWPSIKAGFENWLRPENFDENGQQLSRLIFD